MTRTILAVLLAGLTSVSLAGFSKVGTTAATFLKIGVGRPTGMGEAFVAIADDASAAYWNPAGLAHLSTRNVFLHHIQWVAGINHEYVTAVLPTAGGTLAISATAVAMDTIIQTLVDDPRSAGREDEGTGVGIGATDLCLGISYSRMITERLSFGFTGKLIQERIWDMSASGIGCDIGLLYHTGFRSLRLGVAISNFGSDLSFSGGHLGFVDTTQTTRPIAEWGTTPAPLPTIFRFGIAADPIRTGPHRLTTALDINHPNDINETINVGLEYAFSNVFFLRGGYIFNVDGQYAKDVGYDHGICAGTGFAVKVGPATRLTLDYSYRDLGSQLASAHRVMLGVSF